MFTSIKWRGSKYASTREGKNIQAIVLDNNGFWADVASCLKAAFPLVKVLRMVDGDEKPAMPFIFAEMDRAKEKIKQNFNNVKRSYQDIFAIIDKRWETQMHRPLHAAAYYLNPQYHYSPSFKATEVKRGLYTCLERMIPDVDERVKIDLQIDHFKNASGMFGMESSILTRTKKAPADWWDSYGDDCPELQRFAVKVLSLTCSSSGCERNWSAFEQVHSKRRNRLHQEKMNDLVFVMYNLKLRERHAKRQREATVSYDYDVENIPSDDEWIIEKESPALPQRKDWLNSLDKIAHREAMDIDDDCDPAKSIDNIADNLAEACSEDLGLDQDFAGNACDEEPTNDEEDGCSIAPSTSRAGTSSARLPTINESDNDINLEDLF